jgi:hypothetical protein
MGIGTDFAALVDNRIGGVMSSLLPMQQQSVLLLAARGPDGVGKFHPCKAVVRAYRACVLVAAKYGRSLDYGERADSFMSLDRFAKSDEWQHDVSVFFECIDELPFHYVMHLLHGVEILGYKHPRYFVSERWKTFYLHMVRELHLSPESEEEMDRRLSDWDRSFWSKDEEEQDEVV